MSEPVKSIEDERLALERERIRIERAKLVLLAYQYEIQRRAYRQANRSFMDKIDDFLFG